MTATGPEAADPTGDVIESAASSGLLDTVLGGVPMAMALVDENLRVVRANAALAAIVGRNVEDLAGRSIGEVVPDQAGVIAPAVEEVLATGSPVRRVELSTHAPSPDDEKHWQFSAHAVRDRSGDLLGVGVFLVDISSEHQAARELIDRARRLAAVASLAQRALAGRALSALLDDAVRLVTATLGVEVAQAFELLPGGVLLLRAASGVPDDLVGVAIVDAGRGSQAGYTLLSRAPALTEDLISDPRFRRSAHAGALGLRSGITVVVGATGDTAWGVLGAHSVRTRPFSTDDVHFLELVANVLGVAIQRQQAEDELRASHTRVDLSLRAGGLVSWQWDLETGTLTWDGDVEAVVGVSREQLGRTYADFLEQLPPEERPTVVSEVEKAVQDGDEHHVVASIRPPGSSERWLEVRGRLIGGKGGSPGRLVGVAADITERRLADEIKATMLEGEHQARLEAERARERLTLLAEAGDSLGASLDPIATLQSLCRLVLPTFCDAVMIYSVEHGDLQEVELTHRDAEQAARLDEIRRRREEAGGEGIWSARRAIRTGRSELVVEITDDMLVAAATDDDHLALLRAFDPVSAISLPLVARGRVVGALCLVRTGSHVRYDADDLVLVEELAARAGLAVDNARLFESRSAVARTLQESLLPPALPDIPGLEVATRYRVAGGDIEIGGDFYDLFEMGDGSWSVIVGDVCGKGPEAAALTGLFRHTVRAAAVRQLDPSQVLRFTNSVIIDQIDDTRFCTAALLRIRPAAGHVAVVASSAGHPLPLVVRADGSVERIQVQGTLIGVVPEPTLQDQEVSLGPGDSIVLYTDGVTEARRGRSLFGEPRLRDVLEQGAAGAGAAGIAELIEAAVTDFQGGPGNDDLAVLVLQARP